MPTVTWRQGELPAFVHPKTVAAFERLVSIEEESGYDFKDSCLGPDARDRLKRLQRRAVLPDIGLTTAKNDMERLQFGRHLDCI